jgi:hypothetical protein
MQARLSVADIDHLCNFVGYGPDDAAVWFLGLEERGEEPSHLIKRLQFSQFEDLRRAHVEYMGIKERHIAPVNLQATWNRMCELMLILHGQQPSVSLKKTYQADYLGRRGGDSLLLELMPLPFRDIASFSYDDVVRRFGSKNAYRKEVRLRRIEIIQDLFQRSRTNVGRPRIVICYGASS